MSASISMKPDRFFGDACTIIHFLKLIHKLVLDIITIEVVEKHTISMYSIEVTR